MQVALSRQAQQLATESSTRPKLQLIFRLPSSEAKLFNATTNLTYPQLFNLISFKKEKKTNF